MRNYCKFFLQFASIEDKPPVGNKTTFTNTFLLLDDDLNNAFDPYSVYAQAFQGTHRYTLLNPTNITPVWIELSKNNIYKMFRLLSTSFDDISLMFNESGQFSGTVPSGAFFDFFVFESPRDTWSNGH